MDEPQATTSLRECEDQRSCLPVEPSRGAGLLYVWPEHIVFGKTRVSRKPSILQLNILSRQRLNQAKRFRHRPLPVRGSESGARGRHMAFSCNQ